MGDLKNVKKVMNLVKNLKIAENLVHLRRKRGITQEVLADFLGVSKASVSKWETGLSLPDVAQLPKLASYYDVTIDELMGYEAQLTMREIKEYYERFAEDFSKRSFQDVMEEIHDFVRQYYACYPALLQIVVLLFNHYMLAEGAEQPKILEEMAHLCQHIQEKCTDVNICTEATIFQAAIELICGNPEVTIEKLQPYQNPLGRIDGAETLLVQAYQMSGQMEEATEWNQVVIFTHLLSMVENSTFYLISNLNNKEVGLSTIERIQKVLEVYELKKLHPNAYIKFQYAMALFYATWDMEKEALNALRTFVEDGIDFVKNAAYLHGDAYFDRLDNYFRKMEDYNMLPRNQKTVLVSIGQELEHPVFAKLRNTKEFQELKGREELVNQ